MGKKVHCNPPIFHENEFITDFRERAELFNSLFANQCSLIENTSVLPTNCESLTDKSLSNINFTDNDIGKIIKGLDSNKAHGHDMISIRMLNFAEGPFTNLYGLSSGIVSSKGSLLLLEKRQRCFYL